MPAGVSRERRNKRRMSVPERSVCDGCIRRRKCSFLCVLGKIGQAFIVLSATAPTTFYGIYLISTLQVEEWLNKFATYILFVPSFLFYVLVGTATVWCTDGRQMSQIFSYDYWPVVSAALSTYLSCLSMSLFILAYLDGSLNTYSHLKIACIIANPLIPMCTYVTASNMAPEDTPREFGFLWWLLLCMSAIGFATMNLEVDNRITFFLTVCVMSILNFFLLVGLLWETKVKRMFDIESRGQNLYRILVVFKTVGYVISYLRQSLAVFFFLALFTSRKDYFALSCLSFYCIGGLIMWVVLANNYSQFSLRKKYPRWVRQAQDRHLTQYFNADVKDVIVDMVGDCDINVKIDDYWKFVNEQEPSAQFLPDQREILRVLFAMQPGEVRVLDKLKSL